MKKTTLTRMGLAFCTVCCTVAAITLFAKGDISAGVCGLIMAATLAYFAIRKKRTSENAEVQQPEQSEAAAPPSTPKRTIRVYNEKGGKKYHSDKKCSGMKKPEYVPIEYALRKGYTQCKKCSKLK